jgi:hypothetical protein
MFTFVRTVRGGALEFSIGESSELFSDEDIREFRLELEKIQPPQDPQTRKEYNNLHALLRLAQEDKDLTLLLSVT